MTSISIDFWYQSILTSGLNRLISIDFQYRCGLINSLEQHLMFSERELLFPSCFYETDGWWSSAVYFFFKNVNRSNEMVERAVVYQQCDSYPWCTLYVSRVPSLALWDFSFGYSGFHSSRETRTPVDYEKSIIFLRDSRASNKRARVKSHPRGNVLLLLARRDFFTCAGVLRSFNCSKESTWTSTRNSNSIWKKRTQGS